ncbi:hypothetical protein HNR44_000274 [Geomicrobium halophilum]|uniref:Tetratricopeptide repeat-containing protein n=1 Tax=Geomicrobium halophilum TaxID=549000 RepID=A0A841PWR8_9BACL|nr:tetratricopeptide repeat protein [Geomicrobium halophilum]MBB6448325.1 hypothetical protein [Geomicrobium halophilum]
MGDNDNIVMFPGTIRRLLSHGLTSLETGHFQQGLEQFNQVLQHDDKHEEARYGRLVCLLELGALKEGKEAAEKMLHEGVGEYYDVLFFYVSALVQLGEWEKVVTTVEMVQSEGKLPARYAEQFFQFLATARTMREGSTTIVEGSHEEDELVDVKEAVFEELMDPSPEKQWSAFQQLKQLSWPQVRTTFQLALVNHHTMGMLKTMILLTMKDWEIGTTNKIWKYDKEINVVPVHLDSFAEYEEGYKQSILHSLEPVLGQDNPMLYQTAQSLLEWIFLEYYPLELPEAKATDWAALLHIKSLHYIGGDEDPEKVRRQYEASAEEIEKLHTFVTELQL